MYLAACFNKKGEFSKDHPTASEEHLISAIKHAEKGPQSSDPTSKKNNDTFSILEEHNV
jgi:hypothetical protein